MKHTPTILELRDMMPAKAESSVRRELDKVLTPLVELREWRVALASQTAKMHDAARALEMHRLEERGANRRPGIMFRRAEVLRAASNVFIECFGGVGGAK